MGRHPGWGGAPVARAGRGGPPVGPRPRRARRPPPGLLPGSAGRGEGAQGVPLLPGGRRSSWGARSNGSAPGLPTRSPPSPSGAPAGRSSTPTTYRPATRTASRGASRRGSTRARRPTPRWRWPPRSSPSSRSDSRRR